MRSTQFERLDGKGRVGSEIVESQWLTETVTIKTTWVDGGRCVAGV
jgi:hypothetical protein